MQKRPSTDPNLFAKAAFDKLLAKIDPDSVTPPPEPESNKNPAANRAR